MEDFYKKLDDKRVELGIVPEWKKKLIEEYNEEVADPINEEFIDSIIDYHLLKLLPDFINKKIEGINNKADLNVRLYHTVTMGFRFPKMNKNEDKKDNFCAKLYYSVRKRNRDFLARAYGMYYTNCDGLFIDKDLAEMFQDRLRNKLSCYSKDNYDNNKSGCYVSFDENYCDPDHHFKEFSYTISGNITNLIKLYYNELQAYEYEHGKEYNKEEVKEKAKALKIRDF